jgi:hypothetical protein
LSRPGFDQFSTNPVPGRKIHTQIF